MAGAMSAKHADALLDLLSSDDAFRSMFEAGPEAAMKSIGVPHAAAACCSRKLPSKKTFQESRGLLRSQLTGTLEMSVFKLELSSRDQRTQIAVPLGAAVCA